MTLTQDTVILFAAFVVPGLVAMSVYRLLMPARRLEWGEAIVQGLFYGVLNFLVLYPLIAQLAAAAFREAHPLWTWAGLVATLGLIPAAWPFGLRAVFKAERVSKHIQIPYPTAWDYFFDLREPAFVLVHLRNEGLLGGFWGPKSCAGSFPNDGDIYLEAVYRVNEKGEFQDPIPDTLGASSDVMSTPILSCSRFPLRGSNG